MVSIQEQIEITAPSSTVFSFCHDIVQRPQWDERVRRIELLTAAPIRQGTLIQVDTNRPAGNVFGWEGEYTEFKFPLNSKVQVLDAAPSSPFKSGSEQWSFSKVGDATRVTVVWEYEPRNLIARIIDAVAERAANRRAIRSSLANLKEMLESS